MTVADIIVSPVRILRSTPGTSAPADTVAAGGAWPAGWTEFGYTKTPLTADYGFDVVEHEIQESLAPVGRKKISESLKLETTLAEFTLTNIEKAVFGDYSSTPAGAGQPAKEELTVGDDSELEVLQWGFEGDYVSAAGNTHPIRLFVWKATAVTGTKLEFGKSDSSGVPLHVDAISDMTKAAGQRLFKWQKITAPASS